MKTQILLADDSRIVRTALKGILENRNPTWEISEAENGHETLEKIQTLQPTLVLLDLNLPKLSGLEVLRRLRADRTTRSVNVVIFSSSMADADVRRSTALGIRAYLPKPDNITHYEDMRRSLNALVADVAG